MLGTNTGLILFSKYVKQKQELFLYPTDVQKELFFLPLNGQPGSEQSMHFYNHHTKGVFSPNGKE